MLKASGKNYATAMFGKGCSTMGRFDEAGYDVTDEVPGQPGGNGNGHGSYWDVKKKTPFPKNNPKRMHSLSKDSVDFVNQHAGKQPFFLMVSHYAVHIPHMATDEAFLRTKQRWIAEGREVEKIDNENSSIHRDIVYAAMTEELDMNVGALIDALEQKGELANTYIIFTSDNGGGHSERRKVEGRTGDSMDLCKKGNDPCLKVVFGFLQLLPAHRYKPGHSAMCPLCNGIFYRLFMT
jgi:arylsulfatase A-like enzyme